MFWFAPAGMRGKLLIMIIRFEGHPYAFQKSPLGSCGQGHGRFRFAAQPNEPEGPTDFNNLGVNESKRTQFQMPWGRGA